MNVKELKAVTIILIICHGYGFSQNLEQKIEKPSHFSFTPYGQIGVGFITVDPKVNEGLTTVGLEAGVISRYYFFRSATDYRPAKVSLFLRTGWGPMLIAEKLIPNFWAINPGITVRQFGANASYGFVYYINSSGEGSDELYGFTASLDQLQVPFFISYLFGGDEQKNIILAGIRIPLDGFFGIKHWGKRIQERSKHNSNKPQ